MIWKYLPAGLAHSLAPLGLSYFASKMPETSPEWGSFTWNGIHFPNRLGIAGGMDKNAEHLSTWKRLGAGFIEIGTVTPYAQGPNKGKIVDRDWDHQNLWNKMGFPSHGADEVYFNLLSAKNDLEVPVFVNIGKNRSRPNEEAEIDYLYLTERFKHLADVFVVNVSSPNTSGLRDLQTSDALKKLTEQVVQRAEKTPVLVKLSPDMSEEQLRDSLTACGSSGVSGFILTNTTLSRPSGNQFPKEGGLSGKDLAALSKKNLKIAIDHVGNYRSELLMVSVGGVMTSDDVKERLDMGADLVQCYSALVFNGPKFFRETAARMQS